MKKKLLKGNDVYHIDVVDNKIVINDNYSGLLVFDKNLKLLEKIPLFEDMVIYKSYNLKNGKIILYCPENKKIIYVNLVNKEKKVIATPEDILDFVDLKLVLVEEDECVFAINSKECIKINWKEGKVCREFAGCNQKNCDNTYKNEVIEKFIKNNKDYINIDVLEQYFVIVYEEKIIFYNKKDMKMVEPKRNYIFSNAKIMRDENRVLIIILNNYLKDNNKSIISIIDIS